MKFLSGALFVCLCLNSSLYSQQVTEINITSIGGDMQTQANGMNLSVGELVVGDFSSDSFLISSGLYHIILQYLDTNVVTENPATTGTHFTIEVYPNPVTNLLYIKLPDNFTGHSMILVNSRAALILKQPLSTNQLHMDVSSLMPGFYSLFILSPANSIVSHKIIIKK